MAINPKNIKVITTGQQKILVMLLERHLSADCSSIVKKDLRAIYSHPVSLQRAKARLEAHGFIVTRRENGDTIFSLTAKGDIFARYLASMSVGDENIRALSNSIGQVLKINY